MTQPLHPEPPPEGPGDRSKTRENPLQPTDPLKMPRPERAFGISPRTFRIASLVVAAVATILPFGLNYLTESQAARMLDSVPLVALVHSVKFHESGIIRSKPLRAERNGFTRSFENGKTLFPAEKDERSYAVYDPIEERLLGTITVPDASYTDPILIELDQPSAFWKPTLKSAAVKP